MPVAGAYSMHLYCDDTAAHGTDNVYATVFREFVGNTARECRRLARRAGWTFRRDGTVLCPRCSKRPAPPKEDDAPWTLPDPPPVRIDHYVVFDPATGATLAEGDVPEGEP